MKRVLAATSLLLAALTFAGCHSKVETQTTKWPNGKTAWEYHYYIKSNWTEVKHGVETRYNPDGTIFSQGEWKDGTPWSGVLWKPSVGDAGSAAGLGQYFRYENGREVEKVNLRFGMWGAPIVEQPTDPGAR